MNAFEEIGRLYLDLRSLLYENEKLRSELDALKKAQEPAKPISVVESAPPDVNG